MKNIEQYLTDAASNCAVTIQFPYSSTAFNERVIIVIVFDKDFDEAKTYRFSMTEWQSVLEKASQYDEPLHCCDTCQAKATDEITLLINQRDELLSILQRLKAVDFGEHWNNDAEQAAIAARELLRELEAESGE